MSLLRLVIPLLLLLMIMLLIVMVVLTVVVAMIVPSAGTVYGVPILGATIMIVAPVMVVVVVAVVTAAGFAVKTAVVPRIVVGALVGTGRPTTDIVGRWGARGGTAGGTTRRAVGRGVAGRRDQAPFGRRAGQVASESVSVAAVRSIGNGELNDTVSHQPFQNHLQLARHSCLPRLPRDERNRQRPWCQTC